MSWPNWNQQGAMSLNVQTSQMNLSQIQQQHLIGQQGNVLGGFPQSTVAGISPLLNTALQAQQYGLQNQAIAGQSAVPGAGCTYTPQQWAAIQQQWQWQWQQQMSTDPAVAAKAGYPPLPTQPSAQASASRPPLPVEPPPEVPSTPGTNNMTSLASSAPVTTNTTVLPQYSTAQTMQAYQTGPPPSTSVSQSVVAFSTGVPPPQITQITPGMYDAAQYAQQTYYMNSQPPTANSQMYGANSNTYRQSNQNEKPNWQQSNDQQNDAKIPGIPSLMSMSFPPPSKNMNLDNAKQAGKRSLDTNIVESEANKKLKKDLTRQQMDEETEFDIQFQKWEADFNAWREQNANHPDKKAYQEYELKFLSCRNKLLERREQMRGKRSTEKTNLENVYKKTETNNAIANVNNEYNIPPPNLQENNYYGSKFEQKWNEEAPPAQPNPSVSNTFDSNSFNTDYQKDSHLGSHQVNEDSHVGSYQANEDSQLSFLSEASNGKTFLKNSESKGIPGLDLVPEEEKKAEDNIFKKVEKDDNVIEINDDPEPESETKSKPKPNYNEAISSGINAILADQKLLSMLSIVTKCQNTSEIGTLLATNKSLYNELTKSVQNPSDNSSSTNTSGFGANESPSNANISNFNRQSYNEEPNSTLKPGLLPTPVMPRGFPGDKAPINFQNRLTNNFNQSQNYPDQSPNNFRNFQDQGPNNTNQLRNFQNDSPNNFGPAHNFANRPSLNNMQMDQNSQDYFENDPYGDNFDDKMNPEADRQQNMGGNFPAQGGNQDFRSNDGFNDMADRSLQFGNTPPNRNSFGNNNRFGNDSNRLDFNQSRFDTNSPNINRNLPSLLDINLCPPNNSNFGNEIKSNDSNWSGTSNTSLGNEPKPFMDMPNIFDLTPKQILEIAHSNKQEGNNFNRPSMPGNFMNKSSCPPKEKILGFDPVKIIDYGHKSLNGELNSQIKTLDYGHKTKYFIRNDPPNSIKLSTPAFGNQNSLPSSNTRFGTTRTRPSRFSLPENHSKFPPRFVNDSNYPPKFGNDSNYPDRRLDNRRSLDRYRYEKNIDNQDYADSYDKRDDYNDRSRDRRDGKFNRSERGSRFEKDDSRFDKDNSRSEKDRYDKGSRFDKSRYDKNNRYERDSNRPEKDRFGRDRRYESTNNKKVDTNADKPEQKNNEASTTKPEANIVLIDDILLKPGREHRPPSIVIILRGPPGSGKTHLAKLLKETEQAQGGPAPRILSLDDYFMVEKEVPTEGDGRKTTKMEMQYEYDADMEQSYRDSLVKSFKKTLTDGFFNFVIVDCINSELKHYEEMWNFARQQNFQVYVCQLELDLQSCLKRNIHDRLESEIKTLITDWVPTPPQQLQLDVTSLLQSVSIPEVEMEDAFEEISDKEDGLEQDKPGEEADQEEDDDQENIFRSKWDNADQNDDHLARLDGTSKPLRHQTMEEYLAADWEEPTGNQSGKKRVRWADIEEKRAQDKMRDRGFVVGQTDWDRMLDPTGGQSALTQTKYIERVQKQF